MPTKAVSHEKMGIGKKEGGKHWTAEEVAARESAAEGMKRDNPVRMRVPDWLSDEARKVWYTVVRRSKGLDLYDTLDTESLAVYCDAVIKYRDLSRVREPSFDTIKAYQAQARIIAQYADKLGLTPQSRARLVKKRADEILDEFGDEFD